mgnify:FL=1
MEKVQKVVIDKQRCKGCKLCVNVCPVEIIEMSDEVNDFGYHPAQVKNQKKCLSCGNCARICPDLAIKVFKKDE